MDLNGLKRTIRDEQERKEVIASKTTKSQNDEEYLKKQIQSVQDAKNRLQESFSMYFPKP